jgi:glycosyltransferase involved in cell wall biosynthesis
MLRPPGRFQRFLLRRFEAFLIRKADAVISVNQSIVEELARRYKVPVGTVIMNTPSLAHAMENGHVNGKNIRAQLRVSSDHHLLLYTGKFTFKRGLENLIESLRHLPTCHLVLMGYGNRDYMQCLEDVAAKAQVAPRFSFFGPVSPDEVAAYAADADLGVAPIENACLSYYYCSPNKLFEYIAAGLPVIASDFPELRRVVHDYDIGCTFDPADPQDIARAVQTVLSRPDRLREMRENAKRAAGAFNWENESQKLVALYAKLGRRRCL